MSTEFAIPLLDHFQPPLSRTHPWRGFHGAWVASVARMLNAGVLPPEYYAVPFLDRDEPVAIHVAALRDTTAVPPSEASGAARPWSPPAPGLAVAVEWPGVDHVWVEVRSDDGDPRLPGAVEFVSPRIKDRPWGREAFVAKCAEHLRRGCGVVVDVVTSRRADLYAELLAVLDADTLSTLPGSLSVVSYREVSVDGVGLLQAWPVPLKLGQSLPTVPLWIGTEAAVPLDLHASHSAMCRDLRVPLAG